MSYITKAQLAAYSASPLQEALARINRALYEVKASEKPTNSIFLSHSHKDKDLVFSIKRFLESHGSEVYIDWLDEDMPENTSAETARKIKVRIESNRKFVVMITENSAASRWVPWEIGYADKVKTAENILIIPVADSNQAFVGLEYLRLYYRLERANNAWIAWREDPISGVFLPDWLKR